MSNNQKEIFSRAYQLKDIQKIANIPNSVLSKIGGLTDDTSATTISIADLYELVKSFDKDFSPAPEVNEVLLNSDGTPKVFYHGTDVKFTEFKPEEIASREGSYFFAENREDAAAYGNIIYEVYLSGRNLANYDDQPIEFYRLKNKREQVAWLKERRYDGWYADMDSDGWGELSVFSPEQIKSATDNIGTFSRGTTKMHFSRELSGETVVEPTEKKLTNRAILANALEGAAKTDAEKARLAEYKEKRKKQDASVKSRCVLLFIYL